MTQLLLVVAALLIGVSAGVIVVAMWRGAAGARRDRDLDLISLRDEVSALEDENAILRARLETVTAVTRARAPTQIPLH